MLKFEYWNILKFSFSENPWRLVKSNLKFGIRSANLQQPAQSLQNWQRFQGFGQMESMPPSVGLLCALTDDKETQRDWEKAVILLWWHDFFSTYFHDVKHLGFRQWNVVCVVCVVCREWNAKTGVLAASGCATSKPYVRLRHLGKFLGEQLKVKSSKLTGLTLIYKTYDIMIYDDNDLLRTVSLLFSLSMYFLFGGIISWVIIRVDWQNLEFEAVGAAVACRQGLESVFYNGTNVTDLVEDMVYPDSWLSGFEAEPLGKEWKGHLRTLISFSYHIHIIFIYLNGCRHLNYFNLFWNSLVILCDLHFQPLWCMGLVLMPKLMSGLRSSLMTLVGTTIQHTWNWHWWTFPMPPWYLGPFAQLFKQQLSVQYLLLCNGHHMTMR